MPQPDSINPVNSQVADTTASATPVAADSLAQTDLPAFTPVTNTVPPWQMTESQGESSEYYTAVDSAAVSLQGCRQEGTPHTGHHTEFSWPISILIALLLLLTLNIQNCRRIFSSFPGDLSNLRRRDNAFDEHTSNETRTYLIVVLLLCACEGILAFSAATAFNLPLPALPSLPLIGIFCGVALIYFLFQLGVYSFAGYVFTDNVSTRQWIRGFTASQGLLAPLLIVPAVVAFYYPHYAESMVNLSIILFLIAKLAFIIKGFRIFFDDFTSIVYFILYLCALEITPIIIIAQIASSAPEML